LRFINAHVDDERSEDYKNYEDHLSLKERDQSFSYLDIKLQDRERVTELYGNNWLKKVRSGIE